jgi:hypothetical protein
MTSETFWSMQTAWATWALVLATSVLALGVLWEFRKYRREEKIKEKTRKEDDLNRQAQTRFHFYSQLDSVYYAIQRDIIFHPHLAEPLGEKNPGQRAQYEAHAFMVWNFIEAIYDYSVNDKELMETWSVIIRYESERHRKWFLDAENRPKFKKRFRDFIDDGTFQATLKASIDS